ncbi:MAG TPA: MBL fold metallo-hydrolase [Blastocatellia bacterium]|jgi:glyoxylase-like metal-dependent hydrolase (beta-lactamase superfamily II)|nr:MBL fold metallo-hydrolase [Blastocatellia bacterium]
MKKIVILTLAWALLPISLSMRGSAAPYAHDGSAPQDKGPFTLKKLTEDVYVLYGRGGNIGLAVTSEGAVVIDDQFADLAPGIAEQIKSVTSQPIRYLINTHHHFDHTGGNAFFIKMTTIVAHDNVRKNMLAQPQETLNNAAQRIKETEAKIAKVEKENPKAEELATLRQELANAKQNLETARAVKISDIAAPTLTFDREIRMYLGGKEVQVFHVKRGHTDGDSIIYFPADRVVHMGDLFFNKLVPFIDRAHGGSTSEWIETIDAVVARVDPSSQVIPGHGEATTVPELKAFRQYFVDLRAVVKQAIDKGLSRDQAVKDVKLEQYAQLNGYGQRFASNVGAVYDELKADR